MSINVKIGLMLRSLKALLLVTLTTLFVSAQERPLITDDVDITPQGAFEVGAGVEFLQNAKFPLSGLKGDLTRVGDIRVRTGFASNVEFSIEGTLQNFLAINSQTLSPIPLNVTGNSTNDSGDFILATKIKLTNETHSLPAFGFKFGFQMPNTDQAKGIGTNQTNVFGKVIAQKRFGRRQGHHTPWANIYGNIGLGIMTAPLQRFTQNDVMLYGLAGVFRVNDGINLVSEVNGRMNTRSGAAPLGTESVGQFRVGTQISASGLRFDTAAVFGLTRFSPRSGVVFGVTYVSPQVFTPAK